MRYRATYIALVVTLVSTAPAAAEPVDACSISFSIKYTVVPRPKADRVILTTLIPQTLDGKQTVNRLRYSHKPDKEFTEKGNRYARFVLENVDQPVTVVVRVDAELHRHDLSVLSTRKTRPERFLGSQWLVHEKFLEKDSLAVQVLARQIKGTDDLDTIRKIQDTVQKTLRYTGYNGQDLGALGALKENGGDCNEFADLFVALCRAKGIRARTCEGFTTSTPNQGDTSQHDWVEVYTEQHGWVPVDPLSVALGGATLEKSGTLYIYLSNVRNDRVLDGFHYFLMTTREGSAEVRDSFIIHTQAELPRK